MVEELTETQRERVLEKLKLGRKIEAIKVYRECTGADLKQGVAFIEDLIPKLIEEDPEKYAKLAAATSGGCMGVLIILAVAGLPIRDICDRNKIAMLVICQAAA